MPDDAASFLAQKRGWATLKALHPVPIDLDRIALIRASACDYLSQPANVESLLLALGLNDEGLDELPPALHPHCGGLRIWQYPTQFSKYLVQLSRLGVRSYLELGVRHGGSFVATVEFLERFGPLDVAVGVDIIDSPSMAEYRTINDKARFWRLDSRGPELASRLDALGPIDLVFIDSHHDEKHCRSELAQLWSRADMIAMHDITNVGCPGIGRVWRDLKQSSQYDSFEFVDQYPGLGPFMGIGLLVKRERLRRAETA
jgi:methyltransferase family protein